MILDSASEGGPKQGRSVGAGRAARVAAERAGEGRSAGRGRAAGRAGACGGRPRAAEINPATTTHERALNYLDT